MKKFLTTLAGLLVVTGSWTFAASQPAQAQSTRCPSVTVVGNMAYFKAGPSIRYRTLRVAKKGERFNRTGAAARGGWYQVTSTGGTTGWVHSSVARCASTASTSGRLACANVQVTGPSGAFMKVQPRLSSRTFRRAARGETLMLESPGTPIEYAGWYQVRHMPNNNLYWVHHSVIKCK